MSQAVAPVVQVGLVAAPGAPAELAGWLAGELGTELAAAHPQVRWEVRAAGGRLGQPALDAVGLRKWALQTALGLVRTLLGTPEDADADDHAAMGRRLRELATDPADATAGVAFTARVLTGNLRLLLGMVRANRPWRLAVRLSRALTAAIAAGVFALITADIWRLADNSGWPRLTVVAVGSVVAVVVTLVAGAQLWERPRSPRLRKQVLLFGVATTATVVIGVLTLYAVLFVLALVGALLLVVGPLFTEAGTPGVPVGLPGAGLAHLLAGDGGRRARGRAGVRRRGAGGRLHLPVGAAGALIRTPAHPGTPVAAAWRIIVFVSSIAERFRVALEDVREPRLAVPELLPVQLARACARTLGVDAAGLSVTAGEEGRVPLGASSATADLAERLQFTAGDGPCTSAHRDQEPVFAASADLERRWPAFARLLAEHTPYRAVVALPIGETLAGPGALDLFFTDEAAVPRLDVFEAMAVGDLTCAALGDAAVWAPWSPRGGPAWLHGPAAQRRALVWTAIGRVAMAHDTTAPAALDALRAAAGRTGRTVDDLAGDVVAGRLDPTVLLAPDDLPPAPRG